MKRVLQLPVELIFWILALLLLMLSDGDSANASHFSLCPLANLGITWCPGCGIGRSIAALLHGEFGLSISYHWFGVPALFIIVCRIIVLVKLQRVRGRLLILERKEKDYV